LHCAPQFWMFRRRFPMQLSIIPCKGADDAHEALYSNDSCPATHALVSACDSPCLPRVLIVEELHFADNSEVYEQRSSILVLNLMNSSSLINLILSI